jgi:hypothetical protein
MFWNEKKRKMFLKRYEKIKICNLERHWCRAGCITSVIFCSLQPNQSFRVIRAAHDRDFPAAYIVNNIVTYSMFL